MNLLAWCPWPHQRPAGVRNAYRRGVPKSGLPVASSAGPSAGGLGRWRAVRAQEAPGDAACGQQPAIAGQPAGLRHPGGLLRAGRLDRRRHHALLGLSTWPTSTLAGSSTRPTSWSTRRWRTPTVHPERELGSTGGSVASSAAAKLFDPRVLIGGLFTL